MADEKKVATREENLKKINEELEKLSDEELEQLSDEELDKVAGGFRSIEPNKNPNTDTDSNPFITKIPRQGLLVLN